MKLSDFFKRLKTGKVKGSFSDFFLRTSDQEKRRVFIDAAHRANEDQRKLIERVQQKA